MVREAKVRRFDIHNVETDGNVRVVRFIPDR